MYYFAKILLGGVGWPLVYFFLLNCPVTCCLDPFFHLHKFFHLLPLFYIIGPACHCGRSRLSPSSTFPTPFSLHPTGPACHCGRSRLSPSSTFPTPFSLPPTGPACHCGRSRLFFPLPYPHLSLRCSPFPERLVDGNSSVHADG